jgi:hypothetical protein
MTIEAKVSNAARRDGLDRIGPFRFKAIQAKVYPGTAYCVGKRLLPFCVGDQNR